MIARDVLLFLLRLYAKYFSLASIIKRRAFGFVFVLHFEFSRRDDPTQRLDLMSRQSGVVNYKSGCMAGDNFALELSMIIAG